MKFPLTFLRGKLTNLGVGMASVAPFLQNAMNLVQGEEWQALAVAASGSTASIPVIIGLALAVWGSARRQFNYGGN